ncbi:MAG: hypothetical protein JWM75_452 [Sphingomonas bacterium]|nr:hypothetical protein [Sphingomonas bacterium]
MIMLGGFALLLASSAAAAAVGTGGEPLSAAPIQFAQLIIRERLVVRVPAKRVPPTIKWKTKRAPRCMSAEGMAGAAVMGPDSIDLIARGGQRIRAELQSACPALDFYGGFYLKPSADRKLCAGRDSIHARSGGACEIKRFRKLVPVD